MIYLWLEQICWNSGVVQRNQKSIATFILWATRIEILNESQQFDWQPDITRFLSLWDLIEPANPALATTSLDALLSYVNVDHGRVTERPGSEQGARAASLCLLRALSDVDPTSTVLEDIRERYVAVIPPDANFEGLLCYYAISAVHAVLADGREKRTVSWTDYRPHTQEYIFFANALARVVCKGEQHGKVPHWALRFVIHSLSQDPLSPPLSIRHCLMIIAIDLECNMSDGGVRNLRKRCESPTQLHGLSR